MTIFNKIEYEVEGKDDMETIRIYEFQPFKWLILGLFVWPKAWDYTWGVFDAMYRKGGSVLHAGPVSLALFVGKLK